MLRSFIKEAGKYYSFKEKAMFTRIKLGAWTIIIFCSLLSVAGLSDDSSIQIPVKPHLLSPYKDKVVASYDKNSVQISGELQIQHPTFLQRLLLPDSLWEFDILSNLLLIILAIIVLKLLPHIHSQALLKKDISKLISLFGWALMVFAVLDIARIYFYAIDLVATITKDEFIIDRTGYRIFPIQFWLGIGILWVSRLYKNAFNIKQEQSLTI